MKEKLKSAIKKNSLLLALFMLSPGVVCCSQNEVKSETVYITKTGGRYHRMECTYLGKSKIETKLSDALEKGYEPCKKCDPPRTN